MGFWKGLKEVLNHVGTTVHHFTQGMAITAEEMHRKTRNDFLKEYLNIDPDFLTHEESVKLTNLLLKITDSRTTQKDRIELNFDINHYVEIAKHRSDAKSGARAKINEALDLMDQLGIQFSSVEEALLMAQEWDKIQEEEKNKKIKF